VLLISEDLDELLELADRIVVMSEGQIVFETPAAGAERHVIGAHMGGGHHEPLKGTVWSAALTSAPEPASSLMRIDTGDPFPYEFDVAKLDRAGAHRHAARLHRARRLRRNAGQRRVAARGHRAGDAARCCWPGARPAGWWCTRARRTSRPVGLPAGQAQPRQPGRCASATRGRWAASWWRASRATRSSMRWRRSRRDRHRQAGQGRVLRDRPARTAAAARHHAPAVRRRHHRGLRADQHARGQRPRLRQPAAGGLHRKLLSGVQGGGARDGARAGRHRRLDRDRAPRCWPR
jgi:hypothetical protein